MKKLRIFRTVLKKTHADKIVVGFVIFLLICAFIILLAEPDITKYGDALFAAAVVTGVVVSFYNSCVEQQFSETKGEFLDKLQRLPELSKEELGEIAEKAKKWK